MVGSQAVLPGRPWAPGVPALGMPQMRTPLLPPWMTPWTCGHHLRCALQQEVCNVLVHAVLLDFKLCS